MINFCNKVFNLKILCWVERIYPIHLFLVNIIWKRWDICPEINFTLFQASLPNMLVIQCRDTEIGQLSIIFYILSRTCWLYFVVQGWNIWWNQGLGQLMTLGVLFFAYFPWSCVKVKLFIIMTNFILSVLVIIKNSLT